MKSAGQGMLTKPGSQGWVKQPIPVLGLVQTSVLYSLNPSQAYIAKHVSYPQLTTTRGAPLHVYSIQFG